MGFSRNFLENSRRKIFRCNFFTACISQIHNVQNTGNLGRKFDEKARKCVQKDNTESIYIFVSRTQRREGMKIMLRNIEFGRAGRPLNSIFFPLNFAVVSHKSATVTSTSLSPFLACCCFFFDFIIES